jgi:hypothetical protein
MGIPLNLRFFRPKPERIFLFGSDVDVEVRADANPGPLTRFLIRSYSKYPGFPIEEALGSANDDISGGTPAKVVTYRPAPGLHRITVFAWDKTTPPTAFGEIAWKHRRIRIR